jgi:hypothetical protein
MCWLANLAWWGPLQRGDLSRGFNHFWLIYGFLKSKSTNYPDHGHHGDPPPSRKIPMVEPGIEPGTSWLVVRSSDHQTTRLVENVIIVRTKQLQTISTHSTYSHPTSVTNYFNNILTFRSEFTRKRKGKGKAVPLQPWSGPEGSTKLRFPDFMTTAQDGGKVVSLM